MVRRPKCRLCGHEHYSHEPHEFDGAKPKRADNPLADKPIATKPTLQQRNSIAASDRPSGRLKAAMDRIDELEAEVKALKRALAERAGGRPLIGAKAMTSTERARRARAKAKRDGTVQFEG